MTDLRDIIKLRKQYENRFAVEVVITNGEIVARDGSTRVPNVPNHYWVIPLGDGEPVAVYNRNVKATRPGLAVQIGYAPNSTVLEILRTVIDANSQSEDTEGINLEAHAGSHRVDGDDPLFVEPRAITALLVYPTGSSGLSVHVSSYTYVADDGSFAVFAGYLNFDLSSYQPGSGSLLALVYLDKPTNGLGVATGPTIPQDSRAFTPNAPDLPDSAIPAALVRLGASATEIEWDDIIEARDFLGGGGGANAHPGPGEIKIGTTLYATLEDACAAAVSGDFILIGPGEFLVAATVPDGVGIIGSGCGVTVLGNSGTDTLTVAGISSIRDCSVYSDSGSAIVSSSTLSTYDCAFPQGLVAISGGLFAYGCDIDELENLGVGSVTLYGGRCNNVTITSGNVMSIGAWIYGTVTGTLDDTSWYFNANGRKVEIGLNATGHRAQLQANGPVTTVPDNLAAVVAPTVTDDAADGYIIGSLWFDTAARKIYRLWDATAGAAVWVEIGGAAASAASESVAGIAELATQAETDAGTDDARIVTPRKLGVAATVNKSDKNLLYDTLTFGSMWQNNFTFNDMADDTYIGTLLWNQLNNGQTPDLSGVAGGSSDTFEYLLRCTFDSATSQVGYVQFLLAADTIPLRGATVSLSFAAKGTNVSNLRAAVLAWAGTANILTSDVVGTWATGNPTLATNWSYANTPAASIAISGSKTRYKIEGISIPSTANNIAVFIWTPDNQGSGDLFDISEVQLEPGPVATAFVARKDADEINLRNIFWQASYARGVAVGASSGANAYQFQTRRALAASTAGVVVVGTAVFPIQMWASPTVTLYTSAGTSGAVRNATTSANRTGATALNIGDHGFSQINADNTSATVINLDDIISFHWVADVRM